LLFVDLLFNIFGRSLGGFFPEIDTLMHSGIERFHELVGIEIKMRVAIEQSLVVFRRRRQYVYGAGKTGEINDKQKDEF